MPRPLFRTGSKPERPIRIAVIFSSRDCKCESRKAAINLSPLPNRVSQRLGDTADRSPERPSRTLRSSSRFS